MKKLTEAVAQEVMKENELKKERLRWEKAFPKPWYLRR